MGDFIKKAENALIGGDVWDAILEEARWAPSGDNTQPWRFERVDSMRIIVHGLSTESYCLYDRGGNMSALAVGALLETVSIAASRYGYKVEITVRGAQTRPEAIVSYELTLVKSSVIADPLAPFIIKRQTHRFALRRQALTAHEKKELEQSLPKTISVTWIERGTRDRFARMLYRAGKLKVILPELHALYERVIEKGATESVDRIPDHALGLDLLMTMATHWALKQKKIAVFLNTYCGGTIIPRVETDFIPGFFCGAHFALSMDHYPETMDEWVLVGRSVQRFWLTATSIGLLLQPEMAPLLFAKFSIEGKNFSRYVHANTLAKKIAKNLEVFLDVEKSFFLGRIGSGAKRASRSTRLPLESLWI